MDNFARIAQQKIKARENLVPVLPPAIKTVEVALSPVQRPQTKADEGINTREELLALLDNERKKYAPFLRDLTPKMECYRKRIDITKFIEGGKAHGSLPDI